MYTAQPYRNQFQTWLILTILVTGLVTPGFAFPNEIEAKVQARSDRAVFVIETTKLRLRFFGVLTDKGFYVELLQDRAFLKIYRNFPTDSDLGVALRTYTGKVKQLVGERYPMSM